MSAAAILGAGASIFGQGINWLANESIAQQNFQNQLVAWNMNNQYNSPASQMERFKEAGLNPNLIYGQQNTSQTAAPALIHPEFHYPYEQLGNLLSSSNVIETASREARNWIQTMQQKKESDSRIAVNSARRSLFDISKDLNFLKYSAFHSGDYFGKMVDNLAKRNFALKLKTDIDSTTLDFLTRSLDSRIAAVNLKNDLLRANEQLASQRALSEPARRNLWLSQQSLMRSQRLLNLYRTGDVVQDIIWKNDRNKYGDLYWQGKAASAFQDPLLRSAQTELYNSRRNYTDVKAGLAPWEFGLDAISRLGKLGLDAYKTTRTPFPIQNGTRYVRPFSLKQSTKPFIYR